MHTYIHRRCEARWNSWVLNEQHNSYCTCLTFRQPQYSGEMMNIPSLRCSHWVILQVVATIVCFQCKVSCEIAQDCVGSQLGLECPEMKVINVTSVVLGDSKCWATLISCCIKHDDCTHGANEQHTTEVHRRCDGKQYCTVGVLKEKIPCGYVSWSNNDFERIIYDCTDDPGTAEPVAMTTTSLTVLIVFVIAVVIAVVIVVIIVLVIKLRRMTRYNLMYLAETSHITNEQNEAINANANQENNQKQISARRSRALRNDTSHRIKKPEGNIAKNCESVAHDMTNDMVCNNLWPISAYAGSPLKEAFYHEIDPDAMQAVYPSPKQRASVCEYEAACEKPYYAGSTVTDNAVYRHEENC